MGLVYSCSSGRLVRNMVSSVGQNLTEKSSVSKILPKFSALRLVRFKI